MARRSKQLVTQRLEMVSSDLIEKYQEIIREHIKGRHGIYALYLGDSLQYVGLATNLQGRLGDHLKDRLAGEWDKFSIYLTKSEKHLKDLETLALHIANPPGNWQGMKFVECEDLLPSLKYEYKQMKAQEENKLFGTKNRTKRNMITGRASSGTPSSTRTSHPIGENRGVVPLSATRLFVEIFKANNRVRLTDAEIQAKVVKAFPTSCWRRLAYVNHTRWCYNKGRLTPSVPKEPAKRWLLVNGKRMAAKGPVRGEKPAAGCTRDFKREFVKKAKPATR